MSAGDDKGYASKVRVSRIVIRAADCAGARLPGTAVMATTAANRPQPARSRRTAGGWRRLGASWLHSRIPSGTEARQAPRAVPALIAQRGQLTQGAVSRIGSRTSTRSEM